uniref:Ubiquitin carboxyl-terminal hydrolase 48 n=1 Tax=Steinernema glaseri TaxID=37863 RepID=A0A1I7ZCM3_9BILA
MGNKESSPTASTKIHVSFEDAKLLLKDGEVRRLQAAWGARASMTPEEFAKMVFCHPSVKTDPQLANFIYTKFCLGHSKLTFQNLVIALVVLTKAHPSVRAAFFAECGDFWHWVENPPQLTTNLNQINHTFYEILAGVTHLDENEIVDVEKIFEQNWDPKLCRLTREKFQELVGEAIDVTLFDGFFRAFDSNSDAQIDIQEFVCGVSASCRGPESQRMKFVAQFWDRDSDGFLETEELNAMYEYLKVPESLRTVRLTDLDHRKVGSTTEVACWASEHNFVQPLLEILLQIGHICFGLAPEDTGSHLQIVCGMKERISIESSSLWYIVSSEWWTTMIMALNPKAPTEVPSIDNTPILLAKSEVHWINKLDSITEEGALLKEGISERRDYELVSPSLYRALERWFGVSNKETVVRRVRLPNSCREHRSYQCESPRSPRMENLSLDAFFVDLYPVMILASKHQAVEGWIPNSFGPTLKYTPFCRLTATCESTATEILSQLRDHMKVRDPECIRLWILEIDSKPKKILVSDDALRLRSIGVQNTVQVLVELRNADMSWPEEIARLRNSSDSLVESTNGENGRPSGVTGLYNMGNSCYLNSALQCLSNIPKLTQFFLEKQHINHLNKAAATSTKISVAVEYGNLISELWNGKKRSLAPIRLRNAVASKCEIFADRAQHDCQELLAFLLDFLHEELNKITVKKYVELRDSDGRGDAEVADEAWSVYQSREHSIVTDLFAGQLRSELRCSECGATSSRFDPFTCLQLPIPIDQMVLVTVVVVKRDGNVPNRYSFRIPPTATIEELRVLISDKSKIPVCRIKIVCLNQQSGQLMKDMVSLMADIHTQIMRIPIYNSLLYAFELAPLTPSESSVSAPTLFALHRRMRYNNVYFLKSTDGCDPELFGVPLVLPFIQGRTTAAELYEEVWRQVSRLINSPSGTSSNRAVDASEDLRSGYPFELLTVDSSYEWCNRCHWSKLCRGCALDPESSASLSSVTAIAVDWNLSALYLKYQHSFELLCIDDDSVRTQWEIHNRPLSLASCLDDFVRPEILEDAMTCDKCKEKTRRQKSLSIWRLPEILIVHLKRFVYLPSQSRWVKSSKVIDFPLEDFDPVGNGSQKYKCFAIANHYGAMGQGHYIAYARNGGSWYLFNDCKCQQIQETAIDKKNAYILFYERIPE